MFNLPTGVWRLFFIQIVSSISFSVLYSTLVLYITGSLNLSGQFANNIVGVFVALNFALHLLGGYLGGRFFSYRFLFCISMAAQLVGCLLLANHTITAMYYGLAVFLTGSGLNVTCVNCMLTQQFKPDDSRRESAFLLNYAGMDAGFIIGFSLSGYFQMTYSYQSLFLISSLGNLIALLICFGSWQILADRHTSFSGFSNRKKIYVILSGLLILLCLPFFIVYLLHYAVLVKQLILLAGIAMLVVIYYLAISQPTKEARNKLFAFIVLMLAATVFWTLFQISPMGLTFFIANNVDRQVLNITIAPQWFQNINPFCIALGSPLLGILLNHLRKKQVNIQTAVQFVIALLLIGLAFVILPLGIVKATSDGLVSPVWVVLSYVLQSGGELLLSPIGYAMIGALAPARLQGILMGMWMLGIGIGAVLSSYCSNLILVNSSSINPLITNGEYSHVFLRLGLLAIAASLVLLMVVPIVSKWMPGYKQID